MLGIGIGAAIPVNCVNFSIEGPLVAGVPSLSRYWRFLRHTTGSSRQRTPDRRFQTVLTRTRDDDSNQIDIALRRATVSWIDATGELMKKLVYLPDAL